MPTITEAEAQQLANIMRCWIAVGGYTFAYTEEPKIDTRFLTWACDSLRKEYALPIRIASDRPWTEQIWGPEQTAPSENDK